MDKAGAVCYNANILNEEGRLVFRVFLAMVDIVPAAVIVIPVFAVLYCTVYGHDLRKSGLYCLFCMYMTAVFSLVGIPNVTYFRPEINLNVVPFAGMLADLKNCFLNVLLFIPLGFFLRLFWNQFRNLKSTALFGFGLSLLIELLQMLTFRATDVNDLITNTAGTLLGYLLAAPLSQTYLPVEEGSGAACILGVFSFGVMFLIHPFLSPLIWDRIL